MKEEEDRKRVQLVKIDELTYAQSFAVFGKKAAFRAAAFVLIFGVGLYLLTGETLSPTSALLFFLFDASISTWKHKFRKLWLYRNKCGAFKPLLQLASAGISHNLLYLKKGV